jgi:glycosyltransferase involved in cell wall biosynthesis
LVDENRLEKHVRFLGSMPSDQLYIPLSSADLFVLATANEGWANVFLEAMACGLPVITTDVGGNREVVCNDKLGTIVPFGDKAQLQSALESALSRSWDRNAIIHYAAQNAWDTRVEKLVCAFSKLIELNSYQNTGS